jgi:hypothetical protein
MNESHAPCRVHRAVPLPGLLEVVLLLNHSLLTQIDADQWGIRVS